MHLIKPAAHFAAIASFCLLSGAAIAGKCSGTNINNVISWEPSEIVKGTTLALWRAASVSVSDDPSMPAHLISGECIGSFFTSAEGKTSANGSCIRRDKEGDALYEEWIATDGAGGKGTWKHVGGTGKFAKAAGNGQWEFSPLHGKTAAVRWSGTCQ
jgi:hypothetical protein